MTATNHADIAPSPGGATGAAPPDQSRDDRRLTKKGQAQRDRIVAVAAELIYEHGLQGTSNEMVRQAAGISGSQLSHYFPDKESLVRAVIAWRADTMIGLQQDPPLGPLNSIKALRSWAQSYIRRPEVCQGGCSFGSLASEVMKSDLDVHDEITAGFDRWKTLFLDGLNDMRERGYLEADTDTEELAYGLMAAFQGGMLLSQAADDIRPLKAALDAAIGQVQTHASH